MQIKRGFTVVEMVIVISVVSIMTAMTVVAFRNVNKSADDSATRTEVTQVRKAVQLLMTNNGWTRVWGPNEYAPEANGLCREGSGGGSWFMHEFTGGGHNCSLGGMIVAQKLLPAGYFTNNFDNGYRIFLMTCADTRTFLLYTVNYPTSEEASLYAEARPCRNDLGEPAWYGRNAAMRVK